MVTKWDLIYELRADEKRIRQVQEETAQVDALFGTEKWWAAIKAGSIECRSMEGTITEAEPTSLPDRQEFRMRTPDGSELMGVRHGDPTRYVEGLRIRLDYVTVERAPEAPMATGTTDDVVIAVWIEHSHKRTPYLHSFYPSPPSPI